jgi:hypothetical protein
MRWRLVAITALLALVCAGGVACGGGGGSDTITVITKNAFSQAFLPVLLAAGNSCSTTAIGNSGDVAFRTEGDLFAVAGSSDVTVVSRANGSCRRFADVGGAANPTLLSITPGAGDDLRLFAGDDAGRIWAISLDGSTSALLIDTGSQPITGLAFAPTGYGDFGGVLFAAAGTSGVLRIAIGLTIPQSTTHANPGGRIVDLTFAGTTLFAARATDATHGEIDKISSDGSVSAFQSGFAQPVGIASDFINSELYVTDSGTAGAGDGLIWTIPVAGGTPKKRARYEFDDAAPSGIGFDGIGAIAFIASDPLAIRGAHLPRVDPTNTNFNAIFTGPTTGYGDLEFDRIGGFIVAANDDDDPNVSGDSTQNFLFSAARDASTSTLLSSGVGAAGEDLLSVAIGFDPADPTQQVIYFGSRAGNVYQRKDDGTVTLLNGTATLRPILGLEIAPASFTGFGGDLIATTDDGHVFAIDPQAPTPATPITLTLSVSRLSDLVFAVGGALYLVDNGTSASHVLRVAPPGGSTTWTTTDLGAPSAQLGRADGIEIDEGAHRLLVASNIGASDKLLAVALGPTPATGTVTALADISIDDGFFPSGVVYDQLGTVVVRRGNVTSSLLPVSVAP